MTEIVEEYEEYEEYEEGEEEEIVDEVSGYLLTVLCALIGKNSFSFHDIYFFMTYLFSFCCFQPKRD